MILVADSGGSTTRWFLLQPKNTITCIGIGLNPNSVARSVIARELKKVRKRFQAEEITHLYFYGAGLGTASRKRIIAAELKKVFSDTALYLHTDLEGAARGLLRQRSGIVGIIGTGSNAGIYNGKKITRTSAGKGFPEGDHGSGSWLGLRLLQDDATGRMPKALKGSFSLYTRALRRALQAGTRPAAAVGALSVFAFKKRRTPYIQELLSSCAHLYWEHYLRPLNINRNTSLALTGGMAWNFKKEFAIVMKAKKIKAEFFPDPGKGLAEYHRHLSNKRR